MSPLLQGGAAGTVPVAPSVFPSVLTPSEREFAESLLTGMVSIRSHTGEERGVAEFLTGKMRECGFSSHIDPAGNAVGIAPYKPIPDRATKDIVLLGHMDTVPGDVPVRREGDLLYGRGSVDAKGPLATFVMAVAGMAIPPGIRVIVIGATEEEGISSIGARHAATQYRPTACIIGEPSHWDGVTLGYKGRLLCEYKLEMPCHHSAGPEPSAPELASAWWEGVRRHVADLNIGRTSPFEIVQATLRTINTESDGLYDRVHAVVSFRLPLHINPQQLQDVCERLAREQNLGGGQPLVTLEGPEVAYAGPRDSALVRAFTGTIRDHGGSPHLRVKTGTSDMNVVGPIWKCPIVAYGPGDSRLDHTPNEHISMDEYAKAIGVLRSVLERLASELQSTPTS